MFYICVALAIVQVFIIKEVIKAVRQTTMLQNLQEECKTMRSQFISFIRCVKPPVLPTIVSTRGKSKVK